MPSLNFQLGHMEPEQTDHIQAREQANPNEFSPSPLRWGAQPVVLLPGQAMQPMALSPKHPWDAGKEQGAATYAAAIGYERELLQADAARREDTTAMMQIRKVEGYIWAPRSEPAQSPRKPLSHPVTAEKAWRMFLAACIVFKQIQNPANITLAHRWS